MKHRFSVRRFTRFSLRGMLLLMLALSVWLASAAAMVRERQRAIARVEREDLGFHIAPSDTGSVSLARRLLGDRPMSFRIVGLVAEEDLAPFRQVIPEAESVVEQLGCCGWFYPEVLPRVQIELLRERQALRPKLVAYRNMQLKRARGKTYDLVENPLLNWQKHWNAAVAASGHKPTSASEDVDLLATD